MYKQENKLYLNARAILKLKLRQKFISFMNILNSNKFLNYIIG